MIAPQNKYVQENQEQSLQMKLYSVHFVLDVKYQTE